MPNGRCRLHGGRSTGPRTPKGRANMLAANIAHGRSTAPMRAQLRYARTLAKRTRLICAAKRLHAYLPPEMAAGLSAGPEELWAPIHPSNLPFVQNREPTPCNQPPTSGKAPPAQATAPLATAAHPQSRGLAAERAAARVEAAALAPWREAIALARAARRATFQARLAERAARASAGNPLPAHPKPRSKPTPRPRHQAASPGPASGKNEISRTNPIQPPRRTGSPLTGLTPADAAALRTTTLAGPLNPSLASDLEKRFGPPAPPPGWRIPHAMPSPDPVAAAVRGFLASQRPLHPETHPPP